MPIYQRKRVSLEVSKKACLTQLAVLALSVSSCARNCSAFSGVQVTGCGEATKYDTTDVVTAALQLFWYMVLVGTGEPS